MPSTKLELNQVYFGNWLRDYSQLIDIRPLSVLPEPLLRAIVSPLPDIYGGALIK